MKKHTLESFLDTLPESITSRYSYEHAVYNGNKALMTITCKKHGVSFATTPNHHQQDKGGCPMCKGEAVSKALKGKPCVAGRTTQAVWEARFTEKHGDKFTYDWNTFVSGHVKMRIICPEHGEFYQSPFKHTASHGCRSCAQIAKSRNRTLPSSAWLSRFKGVHGDTYEYSFRNIIGATTDIDIKCPHHGWFQQTPNEHIRGSGGCPACKKAVMAAKFTAPVEHYRRKFAEAHGDRYEYDWGSYVSGKDAMRILCREPGHGWFEQEASSHGSGKGCPKCGVAVTTGTTKTVAYLQQFIEAHGFAVVLEHSPEWLGRKSLDLFVPEAKLAIEFNGAWCHHSSPNSTSPAAKFARNRNAHHDKWKLCRDNGVTLLQIWDFKWDDRKHVYMSKILHYLGLDERVFARKCKLVEVTKTDVKHRYAEWSLEGGMQLPNAAQHYALEYNGQQVMWMTVGTKVREWGHQTELLRMVTLPGVTVVGGVSKMMSLCPKGTVMFTTNDSGSVLKDGTQSSLRYWWYNPQTRDVVTRAAASPAKRERLCGCKHGDGESEKAFMERHGWVQVWDSGLTKFVV